MLIISDQAMRAFIEGMKSDAAFRDKIVAVEDGGERLALIRAEGYAASGNEVETRTRQLSDAELDLVDGGTCELDLTIPPGDVFLKPPGALGATCSRDRPFFN